MRHRQHAVLALATLALAGWLAAAAPSPAAELTGPRTLAVPSACAAPALQLALPAILTPASAAAEPLAPPPLLPAVPPRPTAAQTCQFQCLPMGCETCWIDTKCVQHCCSCNDPRCLPPC
jgi:hypothetical protein